MKYNLLRMTQLILSSMDSDEVNDINDTTESRQVVDIIETTYNDLRSTMEFPEHWDLFELDPSGDVLKPTLMTIPDAVISYDWLKYDKAETGVTIAEWRPVYRLALPDFLDRMNSLDSADANVITFDYTSAEGTFPVYVKNDDFPNWYATPDDHTLLFDSFRVDIDLTLVGNKTQGYGKLADVFTRSNTYTPDMDSQTFTLLFNEAKSQAFIDLKQVANAKADQRARQAKVFSQNNKTRTPVETGHNAPNFPNYGRRRVHTILGR